MDKLKQFEREYPDISITRAEANEAYKAVLASPADVKALAENDLFFFILHILGRADINRDWLYHRCQEVCRHPDGFIDLWAREHYKSTIITFALTIQDICCNPETTAGIFSHSRPIAKGFLRQIKREFEQNDLLQELWPHIRPPSKKDSRTWSEDGGLVVERSTNPKEATVEAWGLVDGQPTGKHFNLLIYDDVVTLESVFTPDQIRKTTNAWKISLNLGADGGRRRIIGTRYHTNDTYAEILANGSAKPRVYPATDSGQYDGNPVLLTSEKLAEKRRDMGPYVFACQMLQNPLIDTAMGFREEWLLYYDPDPAKWGRMNRYILVDPAGEKKNNSDYTVMWVIGLNHDGNYYVIDGVRDRLNLTQRAEKLISLHRKYRPLRVGYEKYGMQADIEHIKYVQDIANYHFQITPLGGQIPKNDRIRKLVPVYEQGRLYMPRRLQYLDTEGKMHNLTEDFITDEYRTFPVSAHDDMLDCQARIIDPELAVVFPIIQRHEDFITMPPGAW